MSSECGGILGDVKKTLGIEPDYDVFDRDVVIFINAALSTLNQLGVGPSEGYSISNESDQWSDFMGENPSLNLIQTYVYLRVRLLFDPPATSFAQDAIQKQILELEWRMTILPSTVDSKDNLHGYE